MHSRNDFMLFSGTSHPSLAKEISQLLNVDLGKVFIEKFPDGEIGVQILENVRGRDVFVVQSIARDPNLYLMELLILVDALRRASARSIVAVIPYYGYARQDRKDKARVPITAKLVANLLVTSGVTRVLTMDLHTEQIQGFFDIPVDDLQARPVFVEQIKRLKLTNCIVVTPDTGSVKLARDLAKDLSVDFAIVDKRRLRADKVEVSAVIGDVSDKQVVLVDDIYSTGSTLHMASLVCRKAGANQVFAVVTHPLPSTKGATMESIDKIFVTNTIPIPQAIDKRPFEIVSIARLFGSAIDSIVQSTSISSLYKS